MNIENDIFNVVEDARFAGEYVSVDLIQKMRASGRSGLAVSAGEEEQFLLVFTDGSVEGAVLFGKNGNLYGDKAIYLCSSDVRFKMYLTEKSIAESVASGCRIYKKGHIQNNHLEEIPEIGEQKKGRGILKLRIVSKGETLAGARVSIRKGRQLLMSEVSGPDGVVAFKLIHGTYDCIIVDRQGTVSKYRIEFNDELIDTIIEI